MTESGKSPPRDEALEDKYAVIIENPWRHCHDWANPRKIGKDDIGSETTSSGSIASNDIMEEDLLSDTSSVAGRDVGTEDDIEAQGGLFKFYC